MAHQIKLTPTKTYATKANAVKAVETKFGPDEHFTATDLTYLVVQGDDGRWFPVFIGDRALRAGVHFHFCVTN